MFHAFFSGSLCLLLPLLKQTFKYTIALLLCAVVLYMPSSFAFEPRAQPLVRTVLVEPQAWGQPLESLGTVYANEQVMLANRVNGFIEQVHVEPGQKVVPEQLLFSLERAQEQARLVEAQVQLDDAQRQLAELSRLAKRQAVSASALQAQQALVEQSKAQLDAAQATLNNFRVHAPFGGVIGLESISPGQYFRRGFDVLSLTNLDSLYVDFTLPSKYLGQIQFGQSLALSFDAYPEQVVTTEIALIDPVVDAHSRNVRIRTHLANPDHRLRPGMLARVKLLADEREAITVPTSSLFYRGAQAFVFVVEREQTARQVAVETGQVIGTTTAIVSGLDPTQWVVSEGINKVRDGGKVRVQEQGL
ncbi:efflux RND transporter periplasmic adaptor subunit [Ferrimonas pelagia]|uniref:Vibriobactin export RND transporter periplasmic adaptor subunit VexG n=1 Tax=Ferrimonas pelagia TaxID=1177826 RepID=A0ABP9F487_9GAMM